MNTQKTRNFKRTRGGAGFTLLEMVIVLGIIALILGAAIGLSGGFMGMGRITATEAKLQKIEAALITYRNLAGFYPSEAQGLSALVEKPSTTPVPRRWEQFFDVVPKDDWGNDFVYKYPGIQDPSRPEVISKGKDMELGTEDDISNQDPKG